ncbi:methionine ABC transporter ATP-binding protein [Paenibacillus sp. sgz500958]|uniref:methionine ABC transporter ATP-binding protein n=1 Tax=Paenibacillus sp. sgz500958 TaxID=3242475 RepID=UPI0036D3E7A6
MLRLHQVSKSFEMKNELQLAVNDVSLEIPVGSVYGIIGPSGAGKSTLLRLMNLLERPDQGTVMLGGKDLTEMPERKLRQERHRIGMIFQQFNLIRNATVARNVAIPLELSGVAGNRRDQRVKECLAFVGLEDKAGHYPSQLSGGQQQRVAIARALANNPGLLLCDEPTSSLDPVTTAEILNVLKHVNESFGVTVVIVTHEMDVVRRICSHVAVMEAGRIIDTFSREEGEFLDAAESQVSYREQILGREGKARV